MMFIRWTLFAQVLVLAAAQAPFNEYILSQKSPILYPEAVYQVGGDVKNPGALVKRKANTFAQASGALVLNGKGSYVTYDFGKNIAGRVGFDVSSVSGQAAEMGFTFTESSLYISPEYCDATQNEGLDYPLSFDLTGLGSYSASKEHLRGGFRYLTVVYNSTGSVSLSELHVKWTATPEMSDPTSYTGYFHSDSERLNRVWYAGAYTNQLCSIDPTTGDALNLPLSGWYYNFTIANGTSALVDGGKRDRLVWPGDIAISGPSIFVSTNSLVPIKNGIDALLNLQTSKGALPYAGPGFTYGAWSFTYHCHTLNDIYDYYLYTGDLNYLKSIWKKYKLAVSYAASFIDSSGLANVTSSADWLRSGMGGHNIEANSILYYTLNNALTLASVVQDHSESASWKSAAAGIPPAANGRLWDASESLFLDNDEAGTTVHPQDGNSWAIIAGVVTESRAKEISEALKSRWIRPYGAPAPEAGATISPFASGFELQAHILAGQADYSVDLMEFMWADFMLDDPRMTNSSFIEGYSTNGSLHYPAYSNDARISHAHGWATAPTSTLTFLVGGLQLTSAAGKTWEIAPALGGLTHVETGYETELGRFSVEWQEEKLGLSGSFTTPKSSSGVLKLPVPKDAHALSLKGPRGSRKIIVRGLSTVTVQGLTGGQYEVGFTS